MCYSRRGFINIIKTNNTFVEFSMQQLIELIADDDLNVRNEENIFDACIIWIDYNVEKRRKVCHLFYLSIHIKYFLFSIDSLLPS